jgi:hypothetical protein
MLSMPLTGSPGRDAVYAKVPAEQRQGGAANQAVKVFYAQEAEAATAVPGEHRQADGGGV